MVALHGTNIARVPLATATEKLKTVDPALYKEAQIFFG
jgi:6-phosphofructokinase 1